jgi:hypothetical protein
VNKPTLSDIEKLFVIVDKYGFSINYFQIFHYGKALSGLSNQHIEALCNRISGYGKLGKRTALSLIFMYCFGDKEKWDDNTTSFKSILSGDNLIIDDDSTGHFDCFHWSESVEHILRIEEDVSFSIIISKQIIEFCSQSNFNYSYDTYISNVILILFEKYFDAIWDYFGEAIIGEYMTFFYIKHFIGTNSLFNNTPGIAFRDKEHNNVILEWCRKNSEIGPERIAYMMPLSNLDEKNVDWNPFSKSIIDEFGSNINVLDNLTANMGTFGSTGSRIPYFRTQERLLEKLINHPILEVVVWANKMLAYTRTTIKLERIDDEEMFLR